MKAEKEAAFAADEMVKKLAEPAPTDPELPNASATTAVASGDTNGALGVLVLLAAILVFVAAAKKMPSASQAKHYCPGFCFAFNAQGQLYFLQI